MRVVIWRIDLRLDERRAIARWLLPAIRGLPVVQVAEVVPDDPLAPGLVAREDRPRTMSRANCDGRRDLGLGWRPRTQDGLGLVDEQVDAGRWPVAPCPPRTRWSDPRPRSSATSRPPSLWPRTPTRAGSTSGRARRYATAAAASAVKSATVAAAVVARRPAVPRSS